MTQASEVPCQSRFETITVVTETLQPRGPHKPYSNQMLGFEIAILDHISGHRFIIMDHIRFRTYLNIFKAYQYGSCN